MVESLGGWTVGVRIALCSGDARRSRQNELLPTKRYRYRSSHMRFRTAVKNSANNLYYYY